MTAIDDRWPEERFYFRSDHYNFARKGVPDPVLLQRRPPGLPPGHRLARQDRRREGVADPPAALLPGPGGRRTRRSGPKWNPESYRPRSWTSLTAHCAMADSLADFNAFRSRMNDLILGAGNLTDQPLLRARQPDLRARRAGHQDQGDARAGRPRWCCAATTASPITSMRCHEEGVSREEFLEIFSVGLVVGGSIVIPHLRRAMARLEELERAGVTPRARPAARAAPPR